MSDDVKPSEDKIEVKKVVYKPKKNSPRTPKIAWTNLKSEYESGTYLNLKELSSKHNVAYSSLKNKIYQEKWNVTKSALQEKVSKRIEERVLSLAEKQTEYLDRLGKRALKYEGLIDNSIEQIGGIVEPSDLDALTRSESRVAELSRCAYRIPTLSNQDLTTGGKDLATSFVAAIQKLRESKDAPRLNSDDLRKALDAEIIE